MYSLFHAAKLALFAPAIPTLVLMSSLLQLSNAAVVNVPFSDHSITYSGSGWGHDLFELRPGLDPAGGGANSSDCALGENATTTRNFGDNFSFTFTGVSVSLITESRADHGFFNVSIDGTTTTVDGYSPAPHCGASFNATGLPLGQHTISAILIARNPLSPWPDSYLQLFSIQYDSGPPGALVSSTSTPPVPASPTQPAPPTTPTDPSSSPSSESAESNTTPAPSSTSHSSTGAIVGGLAGALLFCLCAGVLGWFLMRRRRSSGGTVPYSPSRRHMRDSFLHTTADPYPYPTAQMGYGAAPVTASAYTYAHPYAQAQDSQAALGSEYDPYVMSPSTGVTGTHGRAKSSHTQTSNMRSIDAGRESIANVSSASSDPVSTVAHLREPDVERIAARVASLMDERQSAYGGIVLAAGPPAMGDRKRQLTLSTDDGSTRDSHYEAGPSAAPVPLPSLPPVDLGRSLTMSSSNYHHHADVPPPY